MSEAFQRDCLEILAERAKRGQISRRRFTQLAAMVIAGGPLALRGGPAEAQARQIVLANWGGDAIAAYTEAYGKPFEQETGIPVLMDGQGPTEGTIIAQARSGAPSWDIVDADPFSAITLGREGMLEEIDFDVVDPTKIREGFRWDYAASSYFFSYIIAYDAEKYGDNPPKDMKDFFDTENFPGKRSLYKWGTAMWEAALLADGVAPEDLYPLDIDRAHEKIAELMPHISAYWGVGAESQALLLDGDADMAIIWNTRATLMDEDTGGRIKFTWNQGLLSPGSMAVIKGNPAGRDLAMQFIASAQDPERQLVMFDMLLQGPANPAADALLPEDRRHLNPVDPRNMEVQVALDMEWYADHYGAALEKYTNLVTS